jgi:probable rRNA maturation factor
LGYTEAELSITIVDDDQIARLNRDYRQVEGPTDVLAFAMQDGEFGEICPEVLGDVVISASTAAVMAGEHRCPFPAVLDLLLTHAILHLVGYDHELSVEEAHRMDERTLDLLRQVGYSGETFGWYRSAMDAND